MEHPVDWPEVIIEGFPGPRDGEPPDLRGDIADELNDHLACAMQRELRRTDDPAAAEHAVLDRFGDPKRIARRLWWDAMKEQVMKDRVMIGMMVLTLLICAAVGFFAWQMVQQGQQVNQAILAKLAELNVPARPAAQPEVATDWAKVTFRCFEGEGRSKPAANVSILLKGHPFMDAQEDAITQTTDSQGLATFGPIRPGSYQWAITVPGYDENKNQLALYPGRVGECTVNIPSSEQEADISFKVNWPEDLKKQGCLLFCNVHPELLKLGDTQWSTWDWDVAVASDGGLLTNYKMQDIVWPSASPLAEIASSLRDAPAGRGGRGTGFGDGESRPRGRAYGYYPSRSGVGGFGSSGGAGGRSGMGGMGGMSGYGPVGGGGGGASPGIATARLEDAIGAPPPPFSPAVDITQQRSALFAEPGPLKSLDRVRHPVVRHRLRSMLIMCPVTEPGVSEPAWVECARFGYDDLEEAPFLDARSGRQNTWTIDLPDEVLKQARESLAQATPLDMLTDIELKVEWPADLADKALPLLCCFTPDQDAQQTNANQWWQINEWFEVVLPDGKLLRRGERGSETPTEKMGIRRPATSYYLTSLVGMGLLRNEGESRPTWNSVAGYSFGEIRELLFTAEPDKLNTWTITPPEELLRQIREYLAKPVEMRTPASGPAELRPGLAAPVRGGESTPRVRRGRN